MSRILAASALALSLVAGSTDVASAQSYTAPAGIPAATAPGGLEGFGAPRYENRFERPAPASVGAVYTTGSIHRTRTGR